MKKTLVAAVLLTALFAARNANGTTVIPQTDENTSVSVQNENEELLIAGEHLLPAEMPGETIPANEEIFSGSPQRCKYGVGRYSGSVSIHYYNNCNYNIKIGYKYQFKRCCPTCSCQWSAETTAYATLSRNTSRQHYRTLKQGANQTMTYHLVEFWEQ
jgi:hypothetical protein